MDFFAALGNHILLFEELDESSAIQMEKTVIGAWKKLCSDMQLLPKKKT